MKKILTFMLMLTAALMCLSLSKTVKAAPILYEWDLTSGMLNLSGGTYTHNNVEWTYSKQTFLGGQGSEVQIGSANKPEPNFTLKTSGLGGTITKITVKSRTGGAATISATVGGNSYIATTDLTNESKEYVGEGSSSGEIVLTFKSTSKAFYIDYIKVEYDLNQSTVITPDEVQGFMSKELNTSLKFNWQKTTTQVESGYYLVTSVSELNANDKVLIVNTDKSVAMSTKQNSNNRAKEGVTISNNCISSIADTVEVFTLEAGTKAGTFAFKGKDGNYIYAASSQSNHLRSEATKSDNSSWKITIINNDASIVAQGSNTYNNLKYNPSSSIFSSYASGQSAVQIYKFTESLNTYSTSNVVLRFGAIGLDATAVESLTGATFGIVLQQSGQEAKYYDCTPVKVAKNDGTDTVESQDGQYYQFSVSFDVPAELLSEVVFARLYVKYNGTTYEASSAVSFSVKTLAQAYLKDTTGLDADVIGALSSLA